MKNLYFILALTLYSFCGSTQDLTGFWKGSLRMGGGCFVENNIELQLHFIGDSVYGDSYQYENVNYYVKKRITGKYDRATKRLVIHETTITTFKIHDHCTICVKNFYLSYRKEGNKEVLTGDWDGKVINSNINCSTGPITLSRIAESEFKEIPEILVDTGTLRLDFYDNAQVDGDSITVLVNKVVVVSNQVLSIKPITIYVVVDLNKPLQEVEMQAENLGSIPPNTAMLIITAGTKKYQLFLSSTESKSAMVRFVYDKEMSKAVEKG